MKGGDEDLARDFRDRAYIEANSIQRRRKTRYVIMPHLMSII